jgi:hypothetical protein
MDRGAAQAAAKTKPKPTNAPDIILLSDGGRRGPRPCTAVVCNAVHTRGCVRVLCVVECTSNGVSARLFIRSVQRTETPADIC